MKKLSFLTAVLLAIATITVNAQTSGKLVSSKTQIKFFSTTPAEDIQAANTTTVSTINKETGEVVFSVPMQGFEFEKALMQKHFNGEDFLNTQAFPKAKLKGKITNLDKIDFSKDGTYTASFEGEMTIKEGTKPVKENGTLTVKGNVVELQSKFIIALADYGITFVKGKPSTNIAKTVEITVFAEYKPE
ncbi:MAG: YceI family protein [Bacteroidales bacterium]|nr:YceI family protein [Bacteroidales bacterium]